MTNFYQQTLWWQTGQPHPLAGRKHSEETKAKMGLGFLGKKHTEETKQKMAEGHLGLVSGMKGKAHTIETKRKIGLANKGRIPWIAGKHHTEEARQRISKAHKGRKYPEEYKKHLSEINLGKKHSEETRRKMGEAKRGKPLSEAHKLKLSNALKGKRLSEKQLMNLLTTNRKCPSSLEIKFQKIISRNNLPYKFTGDGSFLIDHKNPDFVNTNGEKICIEVANGYHHQKRCGSRENYKQSRVTHFGKWGWKCIVFFAEELSEENVLNSL